MLAGHETDYSYEIVRYTCKYMGDAYAAFFDPDMPDHGRPQYKAKYYTQPAFTIPSRVRIEDGRLYLPKRGWMRLGPIRRYADGQPLTVWGKQESEGRQPKWCAYIVFKVPVDHPDVCQPAEEGAVGVDRNVGQATDSTGTLHTLPGTTVEDAKIKRYQRRMARQTPLGVPRLHRLKPPLSGIATESRLSCLQLAWVDGITLYKVQLRR